MSKIKRGDIYFIDWSPSRGSEQNGIRPSLILQTDKGNSNNNYPNTIVVTISTKGRKIPFHIELKPNTTNGLTEISYVKCEQILTVSKERLYKKIGEISETEIQKVEKAVKLVLGMI